MSLRIGVTGPGESMTFIERAQWALMLQKVVAQITGVKKWGPALLRKFDVDDPEIFAPVLREAKSAFNRKSVKPVRYDKIPDELIYELGSSITFGGPFCISYFTGADPNGQYHKYAGRTISVSFIDETKIAQEILMKLFVFFIQALRATEGQFDNQFYSSFFHDKMNVTVQDGAYKKIVRYKWTGLFTFLPDSLLSGFDWSGYNFTRLEGHGVIISMVGVEDIEKIMHYNRKVAALYGTTID